MELRRCLKHSYFGWHVFEVRIGNCRVKFVAFLWVVPEFYDELCGCSPCHFSLPFSLLPELHIVGVHKTCFLKTPWFFLGNISEFIKHKPKVILSLPYGWYHRNVQGILPKACLLGLQTRLHVIRRTYQQKSIMRPLVRSGTSCLNLPLLPTVPHYMLGCTPHPGVWRQHSKL